MGVADRAHKVFLIDFGIAMKYCNLTTGNHVPFCRARRLTGTPAFASINSHLGAQLGRCDNIESLAYLLIFVLCSSLPWLTDTLTRSSSILTLKQKTPVEALCGGLPWELATLLTYSQTLSFSDEPDYEYIRLLFRPLLAKMSMSIPEVTNDLSFPIIPSPRAAELTSSPHFPCDALRSPESCTKPMQELPTPSHSKAPALPIRKHKQCSNLTPTPHRELTRMKKLSVPFHLTPFVC